MTKVLVAIALLLTIIAPDAFAAKKNPGSSYTKTIEYKTATNKAFLKAVKKIIKDDPEAASFFEMAERASKESDEHFGRGEYDFALEDLVESTQLAVHAVIIATNKDASLKESILKEELVLQASHDIERKENMLKKGMAEVEVFISTAERLLGQDAKGNEKALATIEDAREHYDTAKLNLTRQDMDGALAEIKKAYRQATQAVKDIKRAQDDIITFPKPTFTDEKEILAYELKKNASYIFFASKVVKEGDTESGRLFVEGQGLKEKADAAMDNGRTRDAIKQLQGSTQLLIKAIKHTYKEN
ncbi:MAG: hypothetical protein ACE5GY_03235 [Thermodesulfobacteriota bacterium]